LRSVWRLNMSRAGTKHVLLTGPPGCGKTTAILGLVERLAGLRLAGFYTQEVREKGQRVGFEAVGLSSGHKTVLAHIRSSSRVRVGRYGVEPEALSDLVDAELDRADDDVDLLVLDEIGKMELLCPAFVAIVARLLDGSVPVVASVAARGGGLIAGVKERPDVQVIKLTADNRDGLPAELGRLVRARLQTR
jgi:nucleoside-triphosphatase